MPARGRAPRKTAEDRAPREARQARRRDGSARRSASANASKREPGARVVAYGDRFEKMADIIKWFREGEKAPGIAQKINEKFGCKLTREGVYPYIQYALARGFLRFHPPAHLALSNRLSELNYFLRRVVVARTTAIYDVAREAAKMLLRITQHCHVASPTKRAIHIGFAAGFSMRMVAEAFADLLCEQPPDLPEAIVFHALVAGFDCRDSSTDPNAFTAYFANRHAIRVETQFVALHAPALVSPEEFAVLRGNPEIDHAYQSVAQLDIIATSGSDWDDEHSSLKGCMERSGESLRMLIEAGAKGDMLWRPLGVNGPIEVETPSRAMTLMDLSDLPSFVSDGKRRVLLMLGPCGGCDKPRGRILHTILRQTKPLATDLVVDTLTASQYLEMVENGS